MKKIIVFSALALTQICSANDSTGYVSTNGIEYLKSKDIQMLSEDLFISKKIIKVDYQFKNLSAQDVTETILFPLPEVESFTDSDFADTAKLIKSFKVWVDGKPIQTEIHVRSFMPPLKKDGEIDWHAKWIDVTDELRGCSFTTKDLQSPWTHKSQRTVSTEKFLACKNSKIQNLLKGTTKYDEVTWSSQLIYSWKQKFKANSTTHVKHQYSPLVGGSVAFSDDYEGKDYCMDANFKAGIKKAKLEQAPYAALGYILKTGANWAKPIENFKLTIERDVNELVSFCWAGKVKKISPTQFQMVEKNFVPKQDLDIIFVKPRS